MSTDVTVHLSDQSIDALDRAAAQLRRNRADVIRLAVESYVDDFDDITIGTDRLQDSNDPVLEWDEAKRSLLDSEK